MYISQTHGARLFVVSCFIVAFRVLCYLKVMVCFIQRSIQSVGPLKAFSSSPPDRPVHSDTYAASMGRFFEAGSTITRNEQTLTFPPLSIDRYSFTQLNGLRRRG